MSKKERQLELFVEKTTPEIDALVFDLECLLGGYKHLAYLTECSTERNVGFDKSLECVKYLGLLCKSLAEVSVKYEVLKISSYWEAKVRYEPYYSPVEPRSYSDLVKIALDYKVRANSLIMRNKAILDKQGAKAQILTREFILNNEAMVMAYKSLCKV